MIFKNSHELSTELAQNIVNLCETIFENITTDSLNKKLHNKKDLLINTAFSNNSLVAFKIGYHLDQNTFYSWLGAVHPDYRQQGLAKKLQAQQHLWAQQNAYSMARVHSYKKWSAMLQFTQKSGLNKIGTELNRQGDTKIIFEKKLR